MRMVSYISTENSLPLILKVLLYEPIYREIVALSPQIKSLSIPCIVSISPIRSSDFGGPD